jgi:threonine dehydrogenase-like Zn-dependent dehydrogenase
MAKMKATVFVETGRIVLDEKPIPSPGAGEALLRITTTTICGTDIHILKGEHTVEKGRTIGHEPVGVIEALGAGVTGYKEGQRVLSCAVTPCGQCPSCLAGNQTHCGGRIHGGWRLGNTHDGTQAEYVTIPNAMANLAPVPDGLTDEQVLMCPDIMSTGFSGAESGNVKIGDTVVVFAQGPIGLCATAGAKLMGATRIITVDSVPERLDMSKRMGADDVINFKEINPLDEIMRLTEGRGVDVAIEACGLQETLENCLRAVKPGGTVSSLGVYAHDLTLPLDAFIGGLGDHKLVTTVCPGGKERMRRMMEVVASGRIDLGPLVTHRYKLEEIEDAYELFGNQRDGVLKVAVTP